MTTFRFLALSVLAVLTLVPDTVAQRRGGGGAVSSGMRGAVVGGMVGGDSGASKGVKLGVAAGATRGVAQRVDNRNAMYTENQARAQYETTAAYQNAPHSNYYDAAPDVIVASATATSRPTTISPPAPVPASASAPRDTIVRKIDASASAASTASAPADQESALSKDGKPIVWVTYPSDWQQKKTDRYITATSKDGHAWSGIAIFKDASDKQDGVSKIKQGLEKYLEKVKYDDLKQTKGDSLLITGTGKAKKAGVDVVFAAGVFDAGPGELAGIAFVADKDLEDHYKEAARYICQTIRTGTDLDQSR